MGKDLKGNDFFHHVLWRCSMPSHVPTEISRTNYNLMYTSGALSCLGNMCKRKMLDWGDLSSRLGSVVLRSWRSLNLKLFFSSMDCYAVGSWKPNCKHVWIACLSDVFPPKHETWCGSELKLWLHKHGTQLDAHMCRDVYTIEQTPC